MLVTNQMLQVYVKQGKTLDSFPEYRDPCKAIVCADGYQVSVQASSMHYCSPRDNVGPYEFFELGFPSGPDVLIDEYAEDCTYGPGGVYPHVPLKVVLDLLNKHGGVQ